MCWEVHQILTYNEIYLPGWLTAQWLGREVGAQGGGPGADSGPHSPYPTALLGRSVLHPANKRFALIEP